MRKANKSVLFIDDNEKKLNKSILIIIFREKESFKKEFKFLLFFGFKEITV